MTISKKQIGSWLPQVGLLLITFGFIREPSAAQCLSRDQCANVLKSAIWKADQMPIPVCWENPTPADAAFRMLVQTAITATWAKESGVRFAHWETTCRNSVDGIRIRISDEWPRTKGLGTQLNGVRDGMVLNFSFKNWSHSCAVNKFKCIKAIAVHEFGHALGFAHEHNRSDTPKQCSDFKAPQGQNGDLMLTKWDADSVMNYCNEEWTGWLSRDDVDAVRTLYGQPAKKPNEPVTTYQVNRARAFLLGFDSAFALARSINHEDIAVDRSRLNGWLELLKLGNIEFPRNPVGDQGSTFMEFAKRVIGALDARDRTLAIAFQIGLNGVLKVGGANAGDFHVDSLAVSIGLPPNTLSNENEYLQFLAELSRTILSE